MNITEILTRLLNDPQAVPDAELLDALRGEYPYLTLPAALALKRGAARMDGAQKAELMEQVALNAAGRDTLFRLIDPDGRKLDALRRRTTEAGSRPAPAATTEKAIDLFLATYGHMEPREEALLERMIFNPVPDYTSMLEREAAQADTPPPATSEQDRMLDTYLREEGLRSAPDHSPAAAPVPAPVPAEASAPRAHKTPAREGRAPERGGSLSESLAQIYIRQRRFDKAYDIIHHLSLNNPEKSVYFADQLRFLQKLMLNNRYRGSRD
ncbi:MAG: hypothetical protein K2J18_00980 [Paramuribaculum sp.]|nr:hypothetical protein [Paramuribaculum sp.]